MTQEAESAPVFKAAVQGVMWAENLHRDDRDIRKWREFHENPAMRQLTETIHRSPPDKASHRPLHTRGIKRLVCSIRSNQL
jgi:hypothetical protein